MKMYQPRSQEVPTVNVVLAPFPMGFVRKKPVGNGGDVEQSLQRGVEIARVADVGESGSGIPLVSGGLPAELNVFPRIENPFWGRKLILSGCR